MLIRAYGNCPGKGLCRTEESLSLKNSTSKYAAGGFALMGLES